MRLLFVDQNGEGIDLSWRAQTNGHAVKHFIKDDPKSDKIGLNIVPVVREWQKHVEWADLVIFADNTLYLRDVDRLRAEGKLVIGASSASAALELDRNLGMSVFKKHDIKTIPYKTFEDYDAAIAYVKRSGDRFVSKPDDDKGDKALSYVSKSAADMVFMLERWKRNDKLHGRFILQQFCPGIEMAVGAWIGPAGFASPWCENWEYKKLMPGDMGPNTGEMGTVLRYVKQSKLANKVLKPLEQYLVNTGHIGYIDVNCIIDDKGTPFPLEFTCRFGWPTANIQVPLHADIFSGFDNLARGGDDFKCHSNLVSIGACVAIPDFPYSHITRKEVVGMPIYGLRPALMEHIHPCNMMIEKNLPDEKNGAVIRRSMFATAGDYVMVVTATGLTISAARETLEQRMKTISIPNSPFHRNDIGRNLATRLPKLQSHGYATGLTYRD